jgi:hypothetical protein
MNLQLTICLAELLGLVKKSENTKIQDQSMFTCLRISSFTRIALSS